MRDQIPDEALPPKDPRSRCIVYIDGFNAYYGIFKNRPSAKWLNIQSFYEALRPRENVVCVKYFTAIVDPDGHSEAKARQQVYLAALRTLSKVRIIFGTYQKRNVLCRLCFKEDQIAEEKKTDVNIAVHMIGDVVSDSVDSIVLISGDSDLHPAITWIRNNRPAVKIAVYVPTEASQQSYRRNDFYRGVSVDCKFLPLDGLLKHQLPDPVMRADGPLSKPRSWI